MEPLHSGGAGQSHPADQPSLAYQQAEGELQGLFNADLLRDLLAEVPGMSLFEVKAALLFVGQKGDMFIMHSKTRGPYWVSAQAVRTAFNLVATDSGMLPPGILRFGTGTNGEPWMAAYIPPARYTLNLVRIEPTMVNINIPLPGFVWAGSGTRYYLWAVKEPLIREETLLYNAPLPNVYTDSGSVCWGNVSVPQVGNATIHTAFRLFIESLFNGNLVARSSHRYPEDVRYLLLELAQAKQRVYPYEDLVPLTGLGGSIYTVRDALASHIISR